MNVRLTLPAVGDLAEAVAYYDERQPGLGIQFADEFTRAVERIVQFPEAWVIFCPGFRRCLMKRFPYGVLYEIQPDTIVVHGIMCLSQAGERWLSRLRELRLPPGKSQT